VSLYDELKRRNVLRVAAAYIVGAWLVVQVVETVLPAFGFGDSALRVVVIALAALLIPVLIFAWAFELTPEGLKREHDVERGKPATRRDTRQFDRMIMVVLAFGVAYFAFDKFVLDPARDRDIAATAHEEGRSQALVGSYSDRSIAVLPFVNMTSDPEQEYFSDGISEEMLNLLANVPDLRVISRTSAFAFKGKDVEIPEIARRLNVAHVLEGSVRKAGNTVRVTAQLIDARSDTHLWSETYDRALEDIFAMQDEIAAAVVAKLKVSLVDKPLESTPVDPDAYLLLLQGRHLRQAQRTEQALLKAEKLLREALAIQPDYLEAWVELAFTYTGLVYRDATRSRAELEQLIQEAYDAAEDLDSDNVHVALRNAARLLKEKRYQEYADRLAAIYSQHPLDAATEVQIFLERLGRYDEVPAIQKMVLLHDPGNCAPYLNMVVNRELAGDWAQVLEWGEKADELCPGLIGSKQRIGIALAMLGRFDEALDVVGEEQGIRRRLYGLVVIHHLAGNRVESDRFLDELETSGEDGPPAFWLASAHAFRGEIDAAFAWLEQFKDEYYDYWWNDRYFPSLLDDPRWMARVEQKGIPKKSLDAVVFDIGPPG